MKKRRVNEKQLCKTEMQEYRNRRVHTLGHVMQV